MNRFSIILIRYTMCFAVSRHQKIILDAVNLAVGYNFSSGFGAFQACGDVEEKLPMGGCVPLGIGGYPGGYLDNASTEACSEAARARKREWD